MSNPDLVFIINGEVFFLQWPNGKKRDEMLLQAIAMFREEKQSQYEAFQEQSKGVPADMIDHSFDWAQEIVEVKVYESHH